MGQIHLLPPEVVNKIAAGEVVERPASIVKELMDNAYDAKSSNIVIGIEEGGIQKIQVTDNGIGMSEDDAINSFERHATSKLNTETDLLSIRTYGFRGEALSSIAAVSKVTLKTRQGQSNTATEVKFEGGVLTRHEETGAPIGTTIIVEDVFYNVPARREFLKASQQEYKQILEIVNKYAIANPSIGITLINNGKVIYSLPKEHQLEDRVRELLGNDTYSNLIPIFYEHPHLEVYGFIGKPELASERKKEQYIFVNKRSVENKNIAFAIKDSYSSLIPKNTYPVFIVFIDVPGNIVDVNVHPRKEEVKFSDDKLIFEGVRNASKKALERFNLVPGSANNSGQQNQAKPPFGQQGTGGGFMPPMNNSPFSQGLPPINQPYSKPTFNPPSFNKFNSNTLNQNNNSATHGFPNNKPASAFPNTPFNNTLNKAQKPYNDPFKKPLEPITSTNSSVVSDKNNLPPIPNDPFNDSLFDDPFGDNQSTLPLENKTAGYNGQIFVLQNLYIFTESKDGVKIYDQHALHERILFEKFKKSYEQEKEQKNTQKLAVPITINLSVTNTELFNQNRKYFEKLGFEIEDFGPNTFKISEVPQVLQSRDLKKIIPELLSDLENEALDKPNENFGDKMLSFLACRSAYKAGDFITDEEIYQMLSDIEGLDNKYTCPHGRPFQVEISTKELEKMFLRS